MKKHVLFLAMPIMLFTACKKDDTGGSTSCTLSSTTIVGKYKITAVTFKGSDAMSFIPTCNQDDVYELKTDNTAIITDAGTQCSPASDETGTWSLSSTMLTTSDPNLSGTVSNFTCTGLKISSTRTVPVLGTGELLVTLTRQ